MRHSILIVTAVAMATLAQVVLFVGCASEPLHEAPVDVDDPIRHFFVHFDDEDPLELESALATYVSFLEGCEAAAGGGEGEVDPGCDLEHGQTTSMLDEADIAQLVEEGRLTGLPTGDQWDQAVSIVVGRHMPISVDVVEDVLLQPDQAEIFSHFESYERTYLTSLDDYQDRSAEFLRTVADARTSYIITWGDYQLYLDFRSLDWDDSDVDRRVMMIRSWLYDGVLLGVEDASAAFTFSLEVNIPYTSDLTQIWRTQAAWSHGDLPGDGDDHEFWEETLRDGTIDGFDELQEWVDEHY